MKNEPIKGAWVDPRDIGRRTTDQITILHTLPDASGFIRRATKKLSRDKDGHWLKSKDIRLGTQFWHEAPHVSDIHTLHEAVLRISHDTTAFIIRGKLKQGVNPSKPVYRRTKDQHGDTAHFEEVPRRWVMLDFDKVPVGDIDLIRDPEDTVEDVIYTHLPALFRDVSCVWQLSSGAGTADLDGVLSLHIWYWLDRPMGNTELTIFHANHAPSVDRAPFRTVQPHFVAKPIFPRNIADPLPRRIGIMQRQFDVLTLPHIDTTKTFSRGGTVKHAGLTGSVRGFEAKLKLLGDGPGRSGFNAVIPAAIASYVCKRFPHEIDGAAIKDRVRDAISAAPVNHSRNDLDRYASDHYLDECLRTATEHFALKSVAPRFPKPSITPSQARTALTNNIVDAVNQEITRLAARAL